MKTIYSLYIGRLNNKQHFTFMQLAVAACTLYSIISEEFKRLFEAFRAAFEHEDDVFIHHDRTEISQRLQDADAERIRLFRHLRDFIKTFETCSEPAKTALLAARTVLRLRMPPSSSPTGYVWGYYPDNMPDRNVFVDAFPDVIDF